MTRQISAMWMAVVVALVGGSTVAVEGADTPYPTLVTAETRDDAEKLSALERPGNVFFQDGFETPDSLKKYFEIRGLQEGRVKLTTDAQLAHDGDGAIQFTSQARDGRESGVGATAWFGPDGYSHWCLSTRHQDSMSELENVMSVWASTQFRSPALTNSSTALLKFSTPPSANSFRQQHASKR